MMNDTTVSEVLLTGISQFQIHKIWHFKELKC